MATVRHLSARPITNESTGAKAESLDPRLAAALRAAAAGPSPETHLRVAHEYLRLGILDTAYTFANRAVLQDPRRADAHEMLARIWRDWGLPGLGLGAAMRATYFDRHSASAENTLGTLFDALGQPAEARQAFIRALTLDPRAGWVLNNLCFVELRMRPSGRGAFALRGGARDRPRADRRRQQPGADLRRRRRCGGRRAGVSRRRQPGRVPPTTAGSSTWRRREYAVGRRGVRGGDCRAAGVHARPRPGRTKRGCSR